MIKFTNLFNKQRQHRTMERIAQDANQHSYNLKPKKMKNKIQTFVTGVGFFMFSILILWALSGVYNAFAENEPITAKPEVLRLQTMFDIEMLQHQQIIDAENARHENELCNLIPALAGAKLLADADGSYPLPPEADRNELATKRNNDCPLSAELN